MELKLGKKPARPNAYSFKLLNFVAAAKLPPAPMVFGHANLVPNLGMLANDQYGDCVWAGAAHETMIWTAESGSPSFFTDRAVLSDYSAVTGFTPTNPNTDQGTDMEEAAKYRRKIGVIDGRGIRHKIDAYLQLPGVYAKGSNGTDFLPAVASSAYTFGALGIGVQFPRSAMEQFNAGKPWSVVKNSPLEGGHYVPLVGRGSNGNFLVVTWGKLQEVTPDFLQQYTDEAIAYVSIERLKNGKTLEGFDIAGLQAALATLSGVTPPTPVPTPAPVIDSNIQLLDKWAAARHTGSNAAAAEAWKAVKAAHNL